jgi:hypothetical protein
MELNMREPLRDLANAFKNTLPEFAMQSLQTLISEIGFKQVKPM